MEYIGKSTYSLYNNGRFVPLIIFDNDKPDKKIAPTMDSCLNARNLVILGRSEIRGGIVCFLRIFFFIF